MLDAQKDKLFAALATLGATKVVAHFQGGNDEGGYEDVTIDATERTVTMTAEEKSEYVTQPTVTF